MVERLAHSLLLPIAALIKRLGHEFEAISGLSSLAVVDISLTYVATASVSIQFKNGARGPRSFARATESRKPFAHAWVDEAGARPTQFVVKRLKN
jgi:hypothetical protein